MTVALVTGLIGLLILAPVAALAVIGSLLIGGDE